MRAALVALLMLVAAPPAAARDVDGVQVPDQLSVTGEKKPLTLNGAGFRKKYMLKVYVGALYTVQPITRAEQILDATTPRVMRLHFVREVSAAKQADGWRDGLADNHSKFEMKAFQTRLTQFNAMMLDVKENDVLRIDFLPKGVTRVTINDKPRGSVEGGDFQRALLRIWLGAKPADSDLKKALLAGKK